MLMLKIENAVIITLALCIALSFYFVILSFQTVDEASKRKLTTLAASFLIASIVIFISLMIYSGIRNIFPTFSIFLLHFPTLPLVLISPSKPHIILLKNNPYLLVNKIADA